ncbi:MAG: HNH endonuclease [Clostridiales bacterium]|jgi:hypothetical protein|nr:HNH endonuclease [Clostridiales bacterium]
MMFGFTEIAEAVKGRFADSPLGRAAMERHFEGGMQSYDAPLGITRLPKEHGKWTGEHGDSKWVPDKDIIPLSQNPEGQTWDEILKGHNIDGVPFTNGEADFSEISRGTVEIDDFTDDRQKNFAQADIKLAGQRGRAPEEVREWRKENGYTWHECKDMRTVQLVPAEVHNNVPHTGGIAEIKRKEAA